MKTPDEIKKELERCTTYICGFPYCEGCLYGIDAEKVESDCVDALLKDALAYIQQLEAAQPKWISVKDRLPEDNLNVLVYAIGNNKNSVIAMTGYTHNMYGYNIEGWRSPWQYFFYEYKITHWMPLPEAPKEDVKK